MQGSATTVGSCWVFSAWWWQRALKGETKLRRACSWTEIHSYLEKVWSWLYWRLYWWNSLEKCLLGFQGKLLILEGLEESVHGMRPGQWHLMSSHLREELWCWPPYAAGASYTHRKVPQRKRWQEPELGRESMTSCQLAKQEYTERLTQGVREIDEGQG